MSVVNQVLLELERRRASGAERGTLPDHVRALPDGGRDNRVWWIAAAGIASLALLSVVWLAAGGFAFLRQASSAAVPAPGTEAVIEKVVSASAAAVTDVRPRDEFEDRHADSLQPAARLSFELAGVPAQRPAAEPKTEASRPAPIPAARVTVAAAKPTADAASKSEIEKQVRQPTGRELADHEYRKGAVLLQQGRLPEAQDAFRAALNSHPGHHGARQALVALLLESKMHAEAERALHDGLKFAPEQIGLAMTLARLQVDRGENGAAIATLQASLGYAQGSADYAAFLAALLQRQGRHEDAIEQFHIALRAKPNAGVWWLGMGVSLQAAHRGAEAQDAYRRAKASNNLNPELAAFADQRLRQLQ